MLGSSTVEWKQLNSTESRHRVEVEALEWQIPAPSCIQRTTPNSPKCSLVAWQQISSLCFYSSAATREIFFFLWVFRFINTSSPALLRCNWQITLPNCRVHWFDTLSYCNMIATIMLAYSSFRSYHLHISFMARTCKFYSSCYNLASSSI